MLEFMFNTVAVIGFLLLLIFAWIGFIFVSKAFKFAADMALLDWKYSKAKKMSNEEASVEAFNKIRKDGEKNSK